MTKPIAQSFKGRYACLLYDPTFKTVICTPENEKLLIEILELLIPDKHISTITFLNNEHYGLTISEKKVIFDLLCKDDNTGEEFLVEVQNASKSSYRDRMLVYSTYPIREQIAERLSRLSVEEIKKDKMDYSLKPIYVVSLVNFSFTHEDDAALEDGYISRYEIRNRLSGEVLTQSLHFVFLELDRMHFKPEEFGKCKTLLERFVFSLKHMQSLEERPEGFEDTLLTKLFKASELANMPTEQRIQYDRDMHTILDYYDEINTAKKEAIETVAQAMLNKGFDVSVIAECTGFTIEEINRLK